MAPGRRIILDANVLVRAVLGTRVRGIITDCPEQAQFFAPEVAYADAEHYLPQILAKHDRADEIEDALAYLEQLRTIVLPVPEEVYEYRRADALSRIESRDPDDWPVLAVALTIECPIWTEDQDFFGAGVPTWTTDRVELYFGTSHPGSGS